MLARNTQDSDRLTLTHVCQRQQFTLFSYFFQRSQPPILFQFSLSPEKSFIRERGGRKYLLCTIDKNKAWTLRILAIPDDTKFWNLYILFSATKKNKKNSNKH